MWERKAYRVAVTREDCRTGEPGECYRCAVALALQRATGDTEAHVYEDGGSGSMTLEVHGRHIAAPTAVRNFIWDFDALPTSDDGRAVGADSLSRPTFTLPPLTDPEWLERCGRCEDLFPAAELDGGGFCAECRGPAAE